MNKITAIMHKEQTVIKWLIILIAHIGFSQSSLSGVYSPLIVGQEYYRTFEFKDNGTFEYHYGASLGDDEYAKGIYYIERDSLFLIYKTEPLNIGYHISKVWENKLDSVKINFNVLDFDNNKLQAATIIYKNMNDSSKYKGVKTDINGEVGLQFKKNSESIKVIISFLGFRPYNLVIAKNHSYDINVYLKRRKLGIPIRNKTEKHKIIERTDTYLKLKKGDKTVEWKKVQ